MLQQQDGKLVVAGYTDNVANDAVSFDDCGIARFDANDQPDPVFGIDGVNNLDGTGGVEPVRPDACNDAALDGRAIVLFGTHGNGSPSPLDSMLMRLDQDDLFRDGFED